MKEVSSLNLFQVDRQMYFFCFFLVPDAPGVSIYATTANSVTVSWIVGKANGILKWVRIKIIVEGQLSWQRNKTILKQERGLTSFRNLMAYTRYEVIAVAASGAGEGPEERIPIKTNESGL